MTYPYESGTEKYVPPALRHLGDKAPAFWLRWGTAREKRHQRRMASEEGITLWDEQAQHDELINGMKVLFSEAEAAEWEAKARGLWDAQDAYLAEYKLVEPADRPEFEYDEMDLILEVLERVGRDHRPYRKMLADNTEGNRDLADIFVAVIVDRFDNLDAPDDKEGGYLTFDATLELLDRLEIFGRKHPDPKAPDAERANAAKELRQECLRRLFLDKDAEKNSPSPPTSELTPSDMNDGAASTSGQSTDSEPSMKTPETA